MDRLQHSSPKQERARPPHPRLPSRSSTRTAPVFSTATAPPPNNGHLTNSATSHTTLLRDRHMHCLQRSQSPQLGRRPQLSREGSMDSAKHLVASQYLQEELAKQRKTEEDKMSRSGNSLSSSLHLEREHRGGSSVRSAETEHRPKTGDTDQAKSSDMGVREMRKAIDQLTNENFSLKLELYHRREKQPQLEARADKLEAENLRLQEANTAITVDLDQRNKAFVEAVSMIVKLEAKVDQMARDLEVVRRIQAIDPNTYTMPGHREGGALCESYAPDASDVEDRAQREAAQLLSRMPSFVSDRHEATENLRQVYLTTHGTSLSLYPPQATAGENDEGTPASGPMSPVLSELSISSFPSVYGPNKPDLSDDICSPVEPQSLDGADVVDRRGADATPVKRSASRPSVPSSHQEQLPPISKVFGGSPLQRIERWDHQHKPDGFSPSKHRDGSVRHLGPRHDPSPRKSTPDEQRGALRKLSTNNVAGGVRLHDYTLPPTPDTMSSSTLRRLKASEETLENVQENGLAIQGDVFNSHSKASSVEQTVARTERLQSQTPSVGQDRIRARDFSHESALRAGNGFAIQQQQHRQRPRSADESTLSHHNGHGWDSDSDGYDDDHNEANVPSLASSDIWIKESKRPAWDRSASPDLFGFSSAIEGWNSVQQGLQQNALLHAHSSQQEALFDPKVAPPAPNRRSSLKAQAAQSGVADMSASQMSTGDTPKQKSPGKSRFMRRNSDAAAATEMRADWKGASHTGETSKKSHYPPITAQSARSGFTRIFRRSLGGSSKSEVPQASAPPEEPAHYRPRHEPAPAKPPHWVAKNAPAVFDDEDRSGATPPPILRKPPQNQMATEYYQPSTLQDSYDQDEVDSFYQDSEHDESVQIAQEAPIHGNTSTNTGAAVTSKKRWLPSFAKGAGNAVMGRTG